jgi:hypothetical protein
MLKRGILSLLVLLLVVCVCAGSLAAAGLIVTKNQNNDQLPLKTPTPDSSPAVPEAQPRAEASPEVSTSVSLQMDQIQAQVSAMRGLTLRHSFKRAVLTPEQLRQKVKDGFLKNYTPQQAADDVVLYSTLGLIKPDTDIIKLYENLYSEQVAGFYDPETQSMYVVQGSDFSGVERMTYAHEFTHTLQDQNYDLRGRMNITDEYCHTHAEYCAAVTALVEGDAVSAEQDWFYRDGTNRDRSQVQDFYLHYNSPVFDSSPNFIKDDLLFPYQKGFEFVQTLYDQGGWQAVDRAFENLPVSTTQILHPGLYPNHKPVTVTLPNLGQVLGSSWHQSEQGSLGEWYTYLVLSRGWQPAITLPEALGQQDAAGWGGDSYVLYQKNDNPKTHALVVEWKWDSLADSDQFWNGLATLCKARWGTPTQESALEMRWSAKDGESAAIQYTNQGTRWIVASTPAVFDLVRAAFK